MQFQTIAESAAQFVIDLSRASDDTVRPLDKANA